MSCGKGLIYKAFCYLVEDISKALLTSTKLKKTNYSYDLLLSFSNFLGLWRRRRKAYVIFLASGPKLMGRLKIL
jgi:hypothetical protein